MIRTLPVFCITLILLSASALLSGCNTVERFSNDSPQMVAEPDKVSAMLADAADRASSALQTLAAVEYSRTPGIAVNPVGDAPAALRRAISVNWVGPVEPITKTLADRAGYRFDVIGQAPPAAIVVSIDAENEPVVDVLRDLGLQLGLRGDIRVDAGRKIIEIHYPTTASANPHMHMGG